MHKTILKLKKFLPELKRYVVKNYGKRCRTFCLGCSSCHAWLGLDIFKDILDNEVRMVDFEAKIKKSIYNLPPYGKNKKSSPKFNS